MADIIDRALDCIRYGLVNNDLVGDLISELKSARAQRDEYRAQLEWETHC